MWPRAFLALLTVGVLSSTALAHGVDDPTRIFLEGVSGPDVVPFMYIGAKHMVTGYDHLLFLVGVIFFLYSTKEVFLYVSLFTIGHSLTLLSGVLGNIAVDPYLIDAIIGFSIVYKGFDNLGGLERLLGRQPNAKVAVLVFGLFHGFGLATKLQEFALPSNGLVSNLVAFNVGVEFGRGSAAMGSSLNAGERLWLSRDRLSCRVREAAFRPLRTERRSSRRCLFASSGRR